MGGGGGGKCGFKEPSLNSKQKKKVSKEEQNNIHNEQYRYMIYAARIDNNQRRQIGASPPSHCEDAET